MLETLIVILLILWLVGAFAGRGRRWGRGGNLIHVLLVIVLILLLIRYL
ncbi:MAG TPA: lmo0937 family membrane protein [Anaerolineales bacterium]|nr:lmo0937 family membrane protein [Anaerolineales bacterium]